jgi:ribosomal protein S18 acetylase RimI-like enzyme
MSIRITAVDARDPKTAALLQYLQLSILPYDDPKETESGWWWIAYDGPLAVGFAALHESVQWCDTAYLSRSGVMPYHRGQGLQKRLLLVRELKARRLKYRWLVTDTYRNPASSNSLISRGFRMYTPSKPWGFEEATYWRKELV